MKRIALTGLMALAACAGPSKAGPDPSQAGVVASGYLSPERVLVDTLYGIACYSAGSRFGCAPIKGAR